MRYLITHLTIPNPVIGTAWESLNCSKFKEEIIEGWFTHLDGGDILIYKTKEHFYKDLLFCGNTKNITISALAEPDKKTIVDTNEGFKTV